MWRRMFGLFVGLVLGAGAFACSSDDLRDGRSNRYDARDAHAADARASERDGEADSNSDAESQCCPISPAPACCMEYGGSRSRSSCGMVCDGMPWPSPAWRIEQDESGCPHWIEPEPSSECCGCVPPDARPPDAGD
jgi:hypothetical protein